MNKAEQRAIEKYPVEMYKEVGWRCVDKNTYKRQYFIEGYHQAEKDLELGWEDLATIEKLGDDFIKQNHTPMSDEEFYKELLKRFNRQRNDTTSK